MMNKINEIVAVTGIFLTLITFLFNIVWPSIHNSLNFDEHISGEKARNRKRNEIIETIMLKSIPLLLGFLILFYINLPSALKIALSSNFTIWNFDVDLTLFIALEVSLFFFVLFNIYVFVKLILKANKFK